jgi:uncharacterized protein YxjI
VAMSNPDRSDLLRSFGMSGYLISEELRTVENTYRLDLGQLPKNTESEKKLTIHSLRFLFELRRLRWRCITKRSIA